MKNIVMQEMSKMFLEELKAYRADHPEDEVVEKLPIRADARFLGKVKAGEIRLFADVYPPRSGLFYKQLPTGEWIVIPLSDRSFTVPASNQEVLLGDKVYQFWNEITLSAFCAQRSYLEGRLTAEELAAIDAVYEHLHIGVPIPRGLSVIFGKPMKRKNDSRLPYFHAFRLSHRDFTLNLIWRVTDMPKKVVSALPAAMAAAGGGDDAPVFIVCRKGLPERRGIYSDDYCECRLALPFTSFGGSVKPKVLKFREIGKLPEEWNVEDGAFVSIHERMTRKQIGTGRISLADNEILIDDFSGLNALSKPIESTAELVLVVTTPGKDK